MWYNSFFRVCTKMQNKNRFSLIAGIIMCFVSFTAISQSVDQSSQNNPKPYSFGGRISLLSEGYAVNGIESRRPPGMGQVNLSTNFSLFGLRSGFNMVYSTDNNQLRQSMNRMNFHSTWRWLTITAGTASPQFSKYSLSGVTVTGGMIQIEPGVFSLTFAGGRSQKAKDFSEKPGFRQPAFERWMYASRIGIGKKDRSGFWLSAVYAYDVVNPDENPEGILPAENLSLSPEFNLSFFKGKFRLLSHVTVSAFTRDQTSTKLDIEGSDVPDLITENFNVYTSTRFDYAGEVSARFVIGHVRIDGTYERIQPGFQSLGLGHIRSDQELYRVRSQLRFFRGKLNLSGNYTEGSNNLMASKISTMYRQQITTNMVARLGNSTNLMLSYMRMSNQNKPVNPDDPAVIHLHQYHISQNVIAAPSFMFRAGEITHNFSVSTSYQTLEDKSHMEAVDDRIPFNFTNITAGGSYGINLPTGLSLSLSGNILRNETHQVSVMGHSINTATGFQFFKKKLALNMTLGWSRNGTEFTRIIEDEHPGSLIQGCTRYSQIKSNGNDLLEGEYVVRQWSQQYSINLSATYRLPNGNPLRLNLRGLSSSSKDGMGRDFNEMRASLRYDHRF